MSEFARRFSRNTLRREQIEHGLWLWRQGVKRFEREAAGGRRGTYEDAIRRGVAWLQQYQTMKELICSYFDFAYLGGNDVNERGEDPFQAACRAAEEAHGNTHAISSSLVEDVSYYRRFRELIERA